MLPILYTRRAELDLEKIANDLGRARGSDFAESYLTGLQFQIESLSQFPRRYRERAAYGKGIGVLVEQPYLVFYRVYVDNVAIMRVLHGRRRITRRMIK